MQHIKTKYIQAIFISCQRNIFILFILIIFSVIISCCYSNNINIYWRFIVFTSLFHISLLLSFIISMGEVLNSFNRKYNLSAQMTGLPANFKISFWKQISNIFMLLFFFLSLAVSSFSVIWNHHSVKATCILLNQGESFNSKWDSE